MKKKYDVYGYTAEKLARAKIYETRNRNQGKLCYLVCPHCHKQVDSISFAPDKANETGYYLLYFSHRTARYMAERNKRTGAELKCCPECGEIFLDPRYREPAIGGTKRTPDIKYFILPVFTFIILIGFALNFINKSLSSDSFPTPAILLSLSMVSFVLITIVIMGISLKALKLYEVKNRYNPNQELENSVKRLKNPDYLKALLRLGRELPVKYRALLQSQEGNTGASTEKDSDSQVYRLKEGCCEYCGCFVKVPEISPSFNRAILKCPQCSHELYDSDICELCAYPEEEQKHKYEETEKGIINALRSEKKIIKNGSIVTVISLAVIFFIGLIMLTGGDSQLINFHSKPKLLILVFILTGLILTIGAFVTCLSINRYRYIMKCRPESRSNEIRKSSIRMNNQDYAQKISKAVKKFEPVQNE